MFVDFKPVEMWQKVFFKVVSKLVYGSLELVFGKFEYSVILSMELFKDNSEILGIA